MNNQNMAYRAVASPLAKLIILGVISSALGACSMQPVKAWQRGDLAKQDMQWQAGLAQEDSVRDHTYVSKEAASLGPSLGGGGCGCN